MNQFDVIIVGAGPAGLACAFSLLKSEMNILLIEKYNFPRDKICGDALSADVIKQLKNFFPDVFNGFSSLTSVMPSYGIKFYAPNNEGIEIEFNSDGKEAPGFICRRTDFDGFLFNRLQLLKGSNITIKQGVEIQNIFRSEDLVQVRTDAGMYFSKIIIGCDGANSVVKRSFLSGAIEKKHHCAGVRAYTKNVLGFSSDNCIELHFIQDILPGYFWIFPLTGNMFNVGLGILSDEVSKKKINLREKLKWVIEQHPVISKRFQHARIEGEIKGFGLPLGSKKRKLSGDRFLLAGDAAGLIDPFTGEGIGNALRSGRYAAEHVKDCFSRNDFSAPFNKNYDKFVYSKTWKELQISRGIQKLLYYPRLFNFLISKARKNPSLKKLLTSMLDDVNLKKLLLKPSFYIKLLFNIQ